MKSKAIFFRIALISALMLCVHVFAHAQKLDLFARFSVGGMASIATISDGRYIATTGFDSLIRI